MREIYRLQPRLGEARIEDVKIDIKCRDEVPAILLGLQSIWIDETLRNDILELLADSFKDKADLDQGRPGMGLWKILVLGMIRLGCNIDFDRLHDLANNHQTLRMFLFHGEFDDSKYTLKSLKDNVQLLAPKVLEEINILFVKAGHKEVKKNSKEKDDQIHGRCDSFVVETDVHYPTDINLLFDAVRKIIEILMRSCLVLKITGWRQGAHLIKTIKYQLRAIEKAKESKRGMVNRLKKLKKSDESRRKRALSKIKKKQAEIVRLHREYLETITPLIERAREILASDEFTDSIATVKVEDFLGHAVRQVNQIERRVLKGEVIPHEEKVFSVFEPHTEWISKGKAGVPQELGLRVSILEDQYGFILGHRVMENETDDQVAIPIVEKALEDFSNLASCSFDKGYYSPENKEELKKIISEAIMPKKGKRNSEELAEESSESFKQKRNQHSAVESAVNGIEHTGLDRCPDHGIDGFKRYVALSVLARNAHRLGTIIKRSTLGQKNLG